MADEYRSGTGPADADLELRGRSCYSFLFCQPGFVKTDFGGDDVKDDAEITPEESVSGALKTLQSKGPGESGSFYNWKGEHMPW